MNIHSPYRIMPPLPPPARWGATMWARRYVRLLHLPRTLLVTLSRLLSTLEPAKTYRDHYGVQRLTPYGMELHGRYLSEREIHASLRE